MAPAPPAVVAVLRALRPVAGAVVLLVHLAQQLPLPVQPLVPADLAALVAELLVLADLVVLVAEVPLQHLLSRQSFSAAMARSSP